MTKPLESTPDKFNQVKPDDQPKPADGQLTGEELDKVSGGTVGSATGGAGAGKVTFNPFSITKSTDSASP